MNISKTLKLGVAVFILASFLIPVSGSVLAHGSHNATGSERCTLRANVSAGDSYDLTGTRNIGAHNSGSKLTLAKKKYAGDHAIICAYGLIKFATNALLVIIVAIATLFIIYAAFLFVTAGESPEKRSKARGFLVYAIIGLVVASVAAFIPTIVRGILL